MIQFPARLAVDGSEGMIEGLPESRLRVMSPEF
jgi:hypothetical protein